MDKLTMKKTNIMLKKPIITNIFFINESLTKRIKNNVTSRHH
jgi:hypothetical protein